MQLAPSGALLGFQNASLDAHGRGGERASEALRPDLCSAWSRGSTWSSGRHLGTLSGLLSCPRRALLANYGD